MVISLHLPQPHFTNTHLYLMEDASESYDIEVMLGAMGHYFAQCYRTEWSEDFFALYWFNELRVHLDIPSNLSIGILDRSQAVLFMHFHGSPPLLLWLSLIFDKPIQTRRFKFNPTMRTLEQSPPRAYSFFTTISSRFILL